MSQRQMKFWEVLRQPDRKTKSLPVVEELVAILRSARKHLGGQRGFTWLCHLEERVQHGRTGFDHIQCLSEGHQQVLLSSSLFRYQSLGCPGITMLLKTLKHSCFQNLLFPSGEQDGTTQGWKSRITTIIKNHGTSIIMVRPLIINMVQPLT